MNLCGACIVHLCKGKGNKCVCSNPRDIGLLSVVGKLYGSVLIKEFEPELNVQKGRSNMSLGRVEDVWTKCSP